MCNTQFFSLTTVAVGQNRSASRIPGPEIWYSLFASKVIGPGKTTVFPSKRMTLGNGAFVGASAVCICGGDCGMVWSTAEVGGSGRIMSHVAYSAIVQMDTANAYLNKYR